MESCACSSWLVESNCVRRRPPKQLTIGKEKCRLLPPGLGVQGAGVAGARRQRVPGTAVGESTRWDASRTLYECSDLSSSILSLPKKSTWSPCGILSRSCIPQLHRSGACVYIAGHQIVEGDRDKDEQDAEIDLLVPVQVEKVRLLRTIFWV